METSLVQKHYTRRPGALLFHYTSSAGLYGILESKTLWTTRIQYLNDAKEFKHAVDVALQEVSRLEGKAEAGERLLYDKLHSRIEGMDGARSFIFSLSEEPDQLSQWRAYCRDGGFSIGFDSDKLITIAGAQGFNLLPCVYDETHQRGLITEVIESTIIAFRSRGSSDAESFLSHHLPKVFYGKFLRLATTIKHPSFAEEREWRLVGGPFPYDHNRAGWRPGPGMLIPYHEFDLSLDVQSIPIAEIVVGPSEHRGRSRNSLMWYLKNKGLKPNRKLDTPYANVSIRISSTPYRTRWS